MDSARCTNNNHLYTAFEFSKLPDAVLEQFRRELICETCKGPAFFRRQSSDGRAPCFGGRPHEAWCDEASKEGGAWGADGTENEDERFNPGDRIVVDLRIDGPSQGAPGGKPSDRTHGQGRVFGGADGPHRARMYQRLRSMLRSLSRNGGLASSTQWIEVPHVVTSMAKDFFVRFTDTDIIHEGKFLGFWGTLTDARHDREGTVWLNTGGKSEPSVRIAKEDESALLGLCDVQNIEELSGAWLLVLGKLGKPKAGNKRFIWHKGPLYLALIPQKRA